jgi:hypothetical protein
VTPVFVVLFLAFVATGLLASSGSIPGFVPIIPWGAFAAMIIASHFVPDPDDVRRAVALAAVLAADDRPLAYARDASASDRYLIVTDRRVLVARSRKQPDTPLRESECGYDDLRELARRRITLLSGESGTTAYQVTLTTASGTAIVLDLSPGDTEILTTIVSSRAGAHVSGDPVARYRSFRLGR